MYKSPIEVYQSEMETYMEGEILKAVMNVGVHVDKEELLKALKYDRDQYSKGYADGIREFTERIVEQLGNLETNIIGRHYYDDGVADAIEIVKKEGLTQ